MKKEKKNDIMTKDKFQSKKQKTITKQPDLRQFMLKKINQVAPCTLSKDAEIPLNCESSSTPSFNSPKPQELLYDVEAEELLYDVELLPNDPGKRIDIMDYPPNQRNAVRRAYILKGPCQPKTHDFPQRDLGGMRRFSLKWFKKYDWLEYSIEKDAAYCFMCYLFKHDIDISAGGDAFVSSGFRAWNKPSRFMTHVGGVKSAHNVAYEKYVNLRDSKRKSILHVINKASDVMRSEYEVRLKASLTCLRFLLRQGLACRGHDESDESINRGNFLELLKWLGEHNDDVKKVTFENAPGNCQMISPIIQQDLINCCAKETSKCIIEELGDDYFGILADESSDISQKEQLALCLRYVNGKNGRVVERFLGLVHVGDTTSLTLKSAIMSLLVEHSLSPSKIRGQGYDGASNMKGEISGLKTLIMKDSPCAYYVHCFAHQLQLTLVAIAKNNDDCGSLFEVIANLLNVVGVSCKRREFIRESQAEKVVEALKTGEIESGSGLNQELVLKRPGDTRWGSHYKTLLNIMHLFPTILEVLEMIGKIATSSEDRVKAQSVLYSLESFDFLFVAHLMLTIFGYTNDLCIALQRRDQDIVNAMSLVALTKEMLQRTRENGWESLLDKVSSFCIKHDIAIPDMDASYVPRGRSKRFVRQRRRDRINEKMKALQKLVPNASKTDKASMLDEVIEYLKQLQAQVHMMSNARSNMPQMMLPFGMQQQLQISLLARMGMGMGMRMGMLDANNLTRNVVPPSPPFPPLMHGAATAPLGGTTPFVGPPFTMPPMVPPPTPLKPNVDAATISTDAYNTFLAQCMNMELLNKMSALYRQQSSSQQASKKADAQGSSFTNSFAHSN